MTENKRGSFIMDERFWFGFAVALAVAFVINTVYGGGLATQAPTSAAAGQVNLGGAGKAVVAGSTVLEQMTTIATSVKVNEKKFAKCMAGNDGMAAVDEDIESGRIAGAQGTPYSILVKGDKTVTINGAQPKSAIIKAMAEFDNLESAGVNLAAVTGDDHVSGNKNAEFTLVEYSDVDCPFCTRFHVTMKELIAENDNVKWVYRHFPLPQLHPDAKLKAAALECAAQVGGNDKFWKFFDELVLGK